MEIFFSESILVHFVKKKKKKCNPPWQSSGDTGCLNYADWVQGITFTLQPTVWDTHMKKCSNHGGVLAQVLSEGSPASLFDWSKREHLAFLSLCWANVISQGKESEVASWLLLCFPASSLLEELTLRQAKKNQSLHSCKIQGMVSPEEHIEMETAAFCREECCPRSLSLSSVNLGTSDKLLEF